MAEYKLYGTKLIDSDTNMEAFARSVMKNVPEEYVKEAAKNIVCREGNNEPEEEFDSVYEDEYMGVVNEIVYHDISRTDIDYSELMCRYAGEIGVLLCDMENHGTDLSGFPLHFYGEGAKESFERLIAEKIWFMRFYEG